MLQERPYLCFNLSANFYIFKPFSFRKPWNQILGATDAFSLIATFTSSFYFISSWSLQPFIFDWGVGCMYVRTYLCCLYRVSRGNVPYFGRMFLTLKYTDITQNTYIRSWTVTEIMAREKCGLLVVPRTVPVSRIVTRTLRMPVLQSHSRVKHIQPSLSTDVTVTVNCNSILLDIHVQCKVLGNLRTTTTLVRVYVV